MPDKASSYVANPAESGAEHRNILLQNHLLGVGRPPEFANSYCCVYLLLMSNKTACLAYDNNSFDYSIKDCTSYINKPQ